MEIEMMLSSQMPNKLYAGEVETHVLDNDEEDGDIMWHLNETRIPQQWIA